MNQNLRKQWTITPDELPSVLKKCSKCGEKTEFKNSGKFRVNANGRLLDIWMIFRCCRCETSYNMSIFERMEAGRVDKAEYKGFLNNSPDLALKYGNDRDLFVRNKAETYKNQTEYHIVTGETIYPCKEAGTWEVEVKIPAGFDLRVDALLVRQLKESRNTIKKWCEEGVILHNGEILSYKSRVRDLMVLQLTGPACAALTKS